MDAYANLNYRNREFKGGGITSRLNTTDNSFLDQTNDSKRQYNNWFGRFGATWHITKSDDLAFNVTGMTGGGDNSENIHYNSIDSQKNTIYTSDRITNGDSDMKMYNLEDGRKQLAVYQRKSNDYMKTCLGMKTPNQLVKMYQAVMF